MVKKFGSEKSSVVKNFGSEKNGSEKFGSQIHHTSYLYVQNLSESKDWTKNYLEFPGNYKY